jgi:hypothetical protein
LPSRSCSTTAMSMRVEIAPSLLALIVIGASLDAFGCASVQATISSGAVPFRSAGCARRNVFSVARRARTCPRLIVSAGRSPRGDEPLEPRAPRPERERRETGGEAPASSEWLGLCFQRVRRARYNPCPVADKRSGPPHPASCSAGASWRA